MASGPGDLRFRPQAWVDLHCHSGYSKDALGGLDEIAAVARDKGLTGVCLTEHDTLDHGTAVAAWNDDHADGGFRFFAGCEISSRQGHVLAYGIDERVAYGLSLVETLRAIEHAGGIGVPAHPVRRGSGAGIEGLEALVRDPDHQSLLSAVEVWNAQQLGGRNRRVATWAKGHGLGGVGGSDAHQVHDAGNGYTVFPEPVHTVDDLVRQLRAGRTWGRGGRTRIRTLLRQGIRNRVKRATGAFREGVPGKPRR